MTHPVDIDALLESLPASGEYVAHAGTPVLIATMWRIGGYPFDAYRLRNETVRSRYSRSFWSESRARLKAHDIAMGWRVTEELIERGALPRRRLP